VPTHFSAQQKRETTSPSPPKSSARRQLQRSPTNRSGYRGVFATARRQWRALICVRGKVTHIGTFESREDAAAAYAKAAALRDAERRMRVRARADQRIAELFPGATDGAK
jgi:hypothetical protein